MSKYTDRYVAGKVLAKKFTAYANRSDVIVLALPRGGVPVAYEIAEALLAPLDVFIVRKLGVPGHEELAMGAIAMGGVVVFNEDIIRDLKLPQTAIDHVIEAEQKELKRRELIYRGDRSSLHLAGKTIILVDDGIATGATVRAAIKALRQQKPNRIILAVPVAEVTICQEMEMLADQVVCPKKVEHFYAVGQWYQDFSQTTDIEVHELLAKVDQPK